MYHSRRVDRAAGQSNGGWRLGQRCEGGGGYGLGTIRYVGTMTGGDHSGQAWVGIELDSPCGKHDGTVHGTRYFSCRPRCGLLIKASKLARQ